MVRLKQENVYEMFNTVYHIQNVVHLSVNHYSYKFLFHYWLFWGMLYSPTPLNLFHKVGTHISAFQMRKKHRTITKMIQGRGDWTAESVLHHKSVNPGTRLTPLHPISVAICKNSLNPQPVHVARASGESGLTCRESARLSAVSGRHILPITPQRPPGSVKLQAVLKQAENH